MHVAVDTVEDHHYEQLEKVMGTAFKKWPSLSGAQKRSHGFAFSRLFIALFEKGKMNLVNLLNKFGEYSCYRPLCIGYCHFFSIRSNVVLGHSYASAGLFRPL